MAIVLTRDAEPAFLAATTEMIISTAHLLDWPNRYTAPIHHLPVFLTDC
ncbi:hypothetical protein RSSM_04231 [Rhodopirellula sallentina SM41]|uniref:Uncharacterized protein n=1 Tax=Rhodopirellula sallentina SM41 TaxID=1263870 RepID=M5TYP5_9BACT|nr:hypothetical protein RSSM_04231 [Rhodopirellula sallentina SM41]